MSGTDLLELTAELVRVPSVSLNEQEIGDLVEARLSAISGLEVVRVGDNVVARTNLGRSRRLILAGHTDTVPPEGTEAVRVDGDVLHGCGAADMKGGLAVFLDLAANLQDPPIDVTFVFYVAEEIAAEHNGLRHLAEVRPDLLVADAAILGEPTDGAIEAGCQGTMRLEITLAGARAHTARPWMGRNAIHRLSHLLALVESFPEREPVLAGCRFREALQAVKVDGGVAGNVVPDRASVLVNHRFAPDRTAEEAEAAVRAHLAPALEDGDEVRFVDCAPAAAPGVDHPLLAALVEANDGEVRAKLGWTDVARFAELGVPAVNYGPGDPLLAHTADERVSRQALHAARDVLHRVIHGT